MNLSDFYAMPDEERAKVLEAVGYKAFGNQELQAENSRLRKLYYLAANDVIFFGTYDRKTDSWPDCGEFYTPVVNLNDTFAYACADGEPVADTEIDRLIAAWKEFGQDGVVAWAALLRRCEPIAPWRTAKYEAAKAKLQS